MLESSLFESQGPKKTRKPVTVVASAMGHVVTVAVLVFIPLLHTQALTIPPVDLSLFSPRIEQGSVPVFSAKPSTPRPTSSLKPDTFNSPTTIPQDIVYNNDPPVCCELPTSPAGGGNILSRGTPLLGSPIPATPPPVPPPTPPPPPSPPPVIDTRPLRQGGDVQAARLIHQVKPVYPAIARQTRTQGVVVLEAVINKQGSIDSLRVISGHLLLTPAALDAVRQWRYLPTMLNSEPVEVITTVTVTFTLQ